MWKKTQFGVLVLAAVSIVAMPGGVCAQKPRAAGNPAPNVNRPAQNPSQPHPNANRPPANPNRAPQNLNRPANRPLQNRAGPRSNFYNQARPGFGARGNVAPRQQLGAGAARPWVDRMRSLTPDQREQVLRNSKVFQNLPPEKQNSIRQQFSQWDGMSQPQRDELKQREEIWAHLTPQQREHIKYDVMPKLQQMPTERRALIQRKLGVLQNMPESARNQRLNDPNFTRGMSDDERSMLKDLSHTHVGGAPEPPGE